MRTIETSMVALLVIMAGCGGEADASEATAPAESAPAPASAAASARGGADEIDLSLPEYQGDHSLPGDPVAGETVYRANCLACHAANGRGNGGITGADFIGDRRRLARNNEVLLRSIREGINNSPAMPAHADLLSDQEMRDALSYVRQTFGSGS